VKLDGDRFRRARDEFAALVELAADERAARLAVLAAADGELARLVGELLAADAAGGGPLDAPLVSLGSAAGDAEPPALGLRCGAYRTVALLGRGGMGEVYLAERADGEYSQRVAVKLLRRGMESAELVRRFQRERQILAQLSHPSLARLLDGGLAEDGRPYLVMELVEGLPIHEHCRVHRASVEERLRLVAACCDAVAAAHRNLVVHRDLKPSNVLVTAGGEVRLLDFGIAKLLAGDEDGLTRAEVRALTPSYAAPEQVLGGPITTATDVYALGVVLYELLTGALPHDRSSQSAADLAGKVTRETVERPSSRLRLAAELGERERRRLARRLAGDLDVIVLKALRRDPERRYPSAAALADDLRRHLAGQPVLARPDSLPYRAGRFVGRHRVAVSAATLAVLALVAGLAAALWQARRADVAAALARAEARRAEQEAERAAVAAKRADRSREFVVSIFDAASPIRRRTGREPTLLELLADAEQRIDAELGEEPAVAASMLAELAGVHTALDEDERAKHLALRSLAMRERLFGPDHLEVADTLSILSDVLVGERDLAGAEAAAKRAVAILERHGKAQGTQLAALLNDLLVIHLHQGRNEDALALVGRVEELYARELGRDAPLTAMQAMNRGTILAQLGRLEEAEAALRDALPRLERAHDREHLMVGYCLQNLGDVLLRLKRPAEAVVPLERGVPIIEARLGAQNPMARDARALLVQAHAEAALPQPQG
jgi:serine/threonine-protein kinase